jgi:hypothetical protein
MDFFSSGLNGKIRYDHFYCIQEKESGFHEFVVYEWEPFRFLTVFISECLQKGKGL